jgi:ElaB/YqjD/DUF883 family membrane-anchored ribosome-binding protein
MEYAQLNRPDTNFAQPPIEPEQAAKNMKATLDQAVASVGEKSRQAMRYADRQVQSYPWTAVGIGFGAGVVFGALVTLLAYSQRR